MPLSNVFYMCMTNRDILGSKKDISKLGDTIAMSNIHRTKLLVQENSIHCASCEKRIRNALNMRPGVFSVKSSSSTHEVFVSHDPEQISLEEIIEILEKMGFPTSLVF